MTQGEQAMSESMVERVKRAIAGLSAERFATLKPETRALLHEQARAAIQAMRNPGQGLLVRAQHAMQTDDLQPTLGEIEAGWWAVIDAALSDTKTQE